jgi:hypothetical protein
MELRPVSPSAAGPTLAPTCRRYIIQICAGSPGSSRSRSSSVSGSPCSSASRVWCRRVRCTEPSRRTAARKHRHRTAAITEHPSIATTPRQPMLRRPSSTHARASAAVRPAQLQSSRCRLRSPTLASRPTSTPTNTRRSDSVRRSRRSFRGRIPQDRRASSAARLPTLSHDYTSR